MSSPPSSALSPLARAAAEGSAARIEELLASGISANQVESGDSWEPLCEAAYRGHLGAVNALLQYPPCITDECFVQRHFEIEGREVLYLSPLHLATIKGHTAVVARLLQADACVDSQTVNCGWTPLHLAAIHNHIDIAVLLLAAGANATAGATTNCPIEQVFAHDTTPLHLASSAEMAELLVDAGADIDARTRFHVGEEDVIGFLPLHYAAARNAHEMIDWLLDRGADVTDYSSFGPPMQRAVMYGNIQTMRKLEAAGAPFIFETGFGWTLLHFCAKCPIDTVEKINLYLELGLDANAQTDPDARCYSVLQVAAGRLWDEEDLPKVIELLLSHGADVHARNDHGITAVCYLLRSVKRSGQFTGAHRMPRSTADALAILLEAGGSLPPHIGPVPRLEAALVPVWRRAPQHLTSLFQLLEKGVQDRARAALRVLCRFIPEQVLRMQVLESFLESE